MWMISLKQGIDSNNAEDAVNACVHVLSEAYGFDVREAREFLKLNKNDSIVQKKNSNHMATEITPIRPSRSPEPIERNFCSQCYTDLGDYLYVDEEIGGLVCVNCRSY